MWLIHIMAINPLKCRLWRYNVPLSAYPFELSQQVTAQMHASHTQEANTANSPLSPGQNTRAEKNDKRELRNI